jgi:DnaJ-class molecular chaperone
MRNSGDRTAEGRSQTDWVGFGREELFERCGACDGRGAVAGIAWGIQRSAFYAGPAPCNVCRGEGELLKRESR